MDEMTFTLNSPITEEQCDMFADVDFEHTNEIMFYTKYGKEVKFVKELHWIPCSERLPEEFGEYLVTKKAIGWNCEEYNSNDIAYFDNEGFHKADKVLAWMPLPKPYGGGSE